MDLEWIIVNGFAKYRVESLLELSNISLSMFFQIIQTEHLVIKVKLTAEGIAFADSIITLPLAESAVKSPLLTPRWSSDERELHVGTSLVKKFNVPAKNQCLILNAFEEEKWPRRIYDPLPLSGDVEQKQRLRDAVKSLNRNQCCELLRFSVSDAAERVAWYLQDA